MKQKKIVIIMAGILTDTMSHYIYNGSFGEGVANFGYASA